MEQSATTLSAPRTLVVGLGATGLSVVRYLRRCQEQFTVVDAAERPSGLEELRREWPEAPVICGALDPQAFETADTVIVSPGVPLDHPALSAARQAGAQVFGDIELFAHEANAPVLGVTGSNGKSTTTVLLGALLEAGGRNVSCGGNLGIPALSLLQDPPTDAYVLELSSFQLEATETLHCQAACILNLSPDHLDRHGDFRTYREVKHRLYRYTDTVVFNRNDPATQPDREVAHAISIGLDAGRSGNDFGIRQHQGESWLCQGRVRIVPCAELGLIGRHNWINAQAALALAWANGIDPKQTVEALRSFTGLPHRMQRLSVPGEVTYINDSKATNVEALSAALHTVDGPCVLLAGGQAKPDPFERITDVVLRHTRALVLYGEAAPEMAQAWQAHPSICVVPTLEEALAQAREAARPGDCVLLSPGCTSFDQYSGFEARGKDFVAQVQAGVSA